MNRHYIPSRSFLLKISGDSRLAKEALKESKLKNNLYIAEDGVEAMNFLYKTGKYSKCRVQIL